MWCNPDENSTDDIYPEISSATSCWTNTHSQKTTHLERGVVQNFNMSVPPGAAGGSVSPQSCLSLSLYSCCLTPIQAYSDCCCLPQSYAPITRAWRQTPTAFSSPPSSSLTWGADVSINTITAAVTRRQSHERTEEAVHTRTRPFSSDKRSQQAPLLHGGVTGLLGNMWTDWGMLVKTRFEANESRLRRTTQNTRTHIKS